MHAIVDSMLHRVAQLLKHNVFISKKKKKKKKNQMWIILSVAGTVPKLIHIGDIIILLDKSYLFKGSLHFQIFLFIFFSINYLY